MASLPRIRNPQPQVEHRILRALEEERRKRAAEHPRRGLYFSELGQCPRKLWAVLNGHPEEDFGGDRLAIFEAGNSVEDLVIRLLELAGYIVTDRQRRVVLSIGGREASGKMDGRILIGKKSQLEAAVLEIKSANADQFKICESIGYEDWKPAYGDALQLYMGASETLIALAVVFCKDNSRIYAEKIRLDPARFEALKKKAEKILMAAMPPARPEEATAQSCDFCRWCHLAEACWGPTWDVRFDP